LRAAINTVSETGALRLCNEAVGLQSMHPITRAAWAVGCGQMNFTVPRRGSASATGSETAPRTRGQKMSGKSQKTGCGSPAFSIKYYSSNKMS
jgi:hypothetical protein